MVRGLAQILGEGVDYGLSPTFTTDSGVGMERYGRTAVALAALALVTSGCGGSDDPAPGADEPGTSTSGSPTSPSSDESPSATTSEPEPTPTVEPASGPTLEVGDIRVTAPAEWRQNNDTVFVDTALGRVGGGQSGGLLLSAVPDDQMSLREALKDSFEQGQEPAGFEEQEATVLGGHSAYYYTAEGNRFLTKHVMGLWDSGYAVHVDVSLPKDMPMEQQQEIVESIRLTYDRG